MENKYMEKALIWGLKKNPDNLFAELEKQYEIIGWVDSNPDLQHQYVYNKYVYAPDEIAYVEFDKIIIGAAIYIVSREIKNTCVNRGIPEEKVLLDYVMQTKRFKLRDIFVLQHKEEIYDFDNFLRMNLLIQYAFVDQYYGKNIYGYEMAEKYMRCVCIEEERAQNHKRYFEELIQSFEKQGFEQESYLAINKEGNLIDGTHRLAYLLWHGVEYADVDIYNTVWNLGEGGERGLDFLKSKNEIFYESDVDCLRNIYKRICEKYDIKEVLDRRISLWDRTVI